MCAGIACALLFLAVPRAAESQETSAAALVLRPHCVEGYKADTWIYGSVPPPGWSVSPDTADSCPPFDVRDPQTLQTGALSVGDTLDIDLVVQNPQGNPITSVRTWLSYDATILEGKTIEVYDDPFTEVIPGEEDFASEKGFAKIHANTSAENPPTSYWVPVARITFTVIKEITPGTAISFFNVQRDGHTYILAKDAGGQPTYALQQEPGALFVRLDPQSAQATVPMSAAGGPCTTNAECESNACIDGICAAETTDGLDPCMLDGECESRMCYEGFCRRQDFRIPNDGACRRDDQCESGVCRNGFCSGITGLGNGEGCTSNRECASNNCVNSVCRAAENPEETPQACTTSSDCTDGICYQGFCTRRQAQIPVGGTCVLSTQCASNLCVEGTCQDPETYRNDRTAFSLLQVRNPRVTSEGDTAFLKWDDLRSSMLKAYNVYYGATSGQYIQRKTIPGTTANVTIRNLPEGTTYYFAIRAVDMNDEETAFSQEVAVEIGNPTTSTAPLIASILTDAPGENPFARQDVGDLPGSTGTGSTLAILLLISAVIGTIFASRRQLATCLHPRTHA
ncbi:MAG: fibronectin type III domain-containing protein [Candidatus Peribacteraceae bacterium]|nr:fibronectin type III domain-containing protein [Candidatus Peribacteraceae bacterium]